MQNTILTGLAVALGSGLMVGIQATFFTVLGRAIGPGRASLVTHVSGGILAGVILFVAIGLQGRERWHIPQSALLSAFVAVAIGLVIITGIAFSFQRMGVAAGLASLFLGQMLVGVVIDMLGAAGGEAIPLDPRRILGLIVMGAAVALLVPHR